MTKFATSTLVATLALAPATAFAASGTLDFESLAPGTIVTNQLPGVTISADNTNNGVDTAVVFDSGSPSSVDADLNGPPWSGGNLAPGTVLGNMLILQEDDPVNGTSIPDDEGARPAGSISFAFDDVITSFGMDIVDVEGPVEFGTESGFFIQFFLGAAQVGEVFFGELVTPGNTFYDPSIEFADNFANRINPFTVAGLNAHQGINGVTGFDTVVISLGGSGAIDNVVFDDGTPIPSPTAAAAGLALLGLSLRRRRGA